MHVGIAQVARMADENPAPRGKDASPPRDQEEKVVEGTEGMDVEETAAVSYRDPVLEIHSDLEKKEGEIDDFSEPINAPISI